MLYDKFNSYKNFANTNERIVFQAINDCIKKLYAENGDKYLFDCKVCERCLMFRLSYQLQLKFSDYFIDCEFNKMGFNGHKTECKVEPDSSGNKLKKMYADIIIHKRNSNTDDNFICIEIKRIRKGFEHDILRLKNMTNNNGFVVENINYVYNYNFGFHLYLPKEKSKSEIRIFKNGEEIINL